MAWLITRLRFFHTWRLRNRVHCTFKFPLEFFQEFVSFWFSLLFCLVLFGFFLHTVLLDTYIFDSLLISQWILPLRVRVDRGVMANKGCFTIDWSPHHQIQFSAISRTPFLGERSRAYVGDTASVFLAPSPGLYWKSLAPTSSPVKSNPLTGETFRTRRVFAIFVFSFILSIYLFRACMNVKFSNCSNSYLLLKFNFSNTS